MGFSGAEHCGRQNGQQGAGGTRAVGIVTLLGAALCFWSVAAQSPEEAGRVLQNKERELLDIELALEEALDAQDFARVSSLGERAKGLKQELDELRSKPAEQKRSVRETGVPVRETGVPVRETGVPVRETADGKPPQQPSLTDLQVLDALLQEATERLDKLQDKIEEHLEGPAHAAAEGAFEIAPEYRHFDHDLKLNHGWGWRARVPLLETQKKKTVKALYLEYARLRTETDIGGDDRGFLVSRYLIGYRRQRDFGIVSLYHGLALGLERYSRHTPADTGPAVSLGLGLAFPLRGQGGLALESSLDIVRTSAVHHNTRTYANSALGIVLRVKF